jgi:hypothetical protein
MPLAFVLDENLRGPLWQALLRHNLRGIYPIDVVRVGDSDELPLSALDAQILIWAERHERLLITEDRHTMASHLQEHLNAGNQSPGVLIARGDVPMRELIECLSLIAHAGERADFANRITYVP